MKMKKLYFLVVLFLCGLSVENLFAAAPAAGHLGQELKKAASMGNMEEIKRLIYEEEADVNAQDRSGFTALMFAALGGHADIVKLLLSVGANIDTQNDSGYTALMNAIRRGHKDIVKLLLQAGAEVNAITQYGYTALMFAALGGHVDIAEQLLDAGADKNIENFKNLTAADLATVNSPNLANYIEDYVPGQTIKKHTFEDYTPSEQTIKPVK